MSFRQAAAAQPFLTYDADRRTAIATGSRFAAALRPIRAGQHPWMPPTPQRFAAALRPIRAGQHPWMPPTPQRFAPPTYNYIGTNTDAAATDAGTGLDPNAGAGTSTGATGGSSDAAAAPGLLARGAAFVRAHWLLLALLAVGGYFLVHHFRKGGGAAAPAAAG